MTARNAPAEHDTARLQRSSGTGRLSVVHLDAETRLKTLYQQGCARLRLPRHRGRHGLEAVMINTAGGMTGGDELAWSFEAGPGTALSVTTQASEKIYRSAGAAAKITVTIRAGAGSRLSWLPQETILFDRGALERRITAHLDGQSEALFVEPVVFGRTAMREEVVTGSLRDRWRLFVDGKAVHAEEFAIAGRIADRLKAGAVAGGDHAFATVLLISPRAEALVTDARRLIGDAGGASAWSGKLLIRLVAANGYELRRRLVPVIGLLEPQTPLPKLWTL
ncbi:MAG: urease accessory protein UreD [Nitratireductor sp.]|nr:urease accessory protein UreD [Nitratireductor sp.]